jgi:hypothetical protein
VERKLFLYLCMAVRTHHPLTEETWFITFTCHNWIPLFEITKSYYWYTTG